MAPEAISGGGYGLSADLWSVGIILYELLYGYVPFGDEEDEPLIVYQLVLNSQVKFPKSRRVTPEAFSLVRQLLNKKPGLRGNCANIMRHPWFGDINLDLLLGQQVTPPFYPKQKSTKA